MNHGRAYFVLGPESSGTRLAAQILINAGCHGSSDHVQPLDDDQFNLSTIPISTPIVWRRSFPHNNEIPSLHDMLRRVRPRRVTAVVTVRDWYCVQQSQIRDHQHAKTTDQADLNISHAYEMIFHKMKICGVQYRIFSYESMVLSPTAQSRFLEGLGLGATPVEGSSATGAQFPSPLIDIHDANVKYWR